VSFVGRDIAQGCQQPNRISESVNVTCWTEEGVGGRKLQLN